MPHLSSPLSWQHLFHHAADPDLLAQDLAMHVAEAVRTTLSRQAQALLVVSGGRTPIPFFEALSRMHLAWSRVIVTLADERWVAPDQDESNERLVRVHLLKNEASQASFVGLYRAGRSASEAQSQVECDLAALPWPATAVILGMGGDGHTASLFPDATELPHAMGAQDKRVISVMAPAAPNVPLARLTLTRKALLEAEQVIVHITGEDKLELLHQAMIPGPLEEYPIRCVLQQHDVPCHVFQA